MFADHGLILTLGQEGPAPATTPASGGNGGDNSTATEGADGKAGSDGSGQSGGGFIEMMPMILLMIVIMWVILFLPQRREKKKRAAMMSEMKKGEKIQTVGGILGTIVELRDHEVVIKIDESTNTRMRITRGAIHSILPDGKPVENGKTLEDAKQEK